MLFVPSVLGHGGEHELDQQLVKNGEDLLLGQFTATQPGPLLVVPYTDGALGCVGSATAPYRIPLSEDTSVMFAANETQVQVLIDMAPNSTGYAGFAVDTHDATRALLMMQENAVALHALVGVVRTAGDNGTHGEAKTGALGVPYVLPGAKDIGHGAPHEGRTFHLAHDGSFGSPRWCSDESGSHLVLAIARASLPESLSGGLIVHVVVLVDATFAQFLPRALEESTLVYEANLYLAHWGEDVARVRAAFDPAPSAHDVVPLAAVGVLGLWLARRR